MSDGMIHPNNEITGLVPVNQHQHDESRKYKKQKKRDKDEDAPPDIPEEAVEDLLHHPEDHDIADATGSKSSEAPENNDARDHLDLLL